MQNTITEIKNSLEATNSRIQEAEERISEVKDRLVEITDAEQKREKRLKTNEESLILTSNKQVRNQGTRQTNKTVIMRTMFRTAILTNKNILEIKVYFFTNPFNHLLKIRNTKARKTSKIWELVRTSRQKLIFISQGKEKELIIH